MPHFEVALARYASVVVETDTPEAAEQAARDMAARGDAAVQFSGVEVESIERVQVDANGEVIR